MRITSEELREARRTIDMTQARLANELGVALRTIVNWESESGTGVPSKWTKRVEDIMGGALQFARRNLSAPRYEPTQEEIDENYRIYLAMNDGVDPADQPGQFDQLDAEQRRYGTNFSQYKTSLLGLFTDIDLLSEVSRRARNRGDGASSWTVSAIENDPARQKALRQRAAELIELSGADPDYSDRTQDEHGLAAYEGDKDIAFDADPED